MDRRPSELPPSLIPHLYAAPRGSSTRTTLTSHSEDSDRDDSLLPPIPPITRRSSSPIADDRQLPVPPVPPSHRSLESSSNLRHSVSSTYSNPPFIYPSSQSSSTSIFLPPFESFSAKNIFPGNSSWREGEAGPSSLIHPSQRDYNTRRASQPARVNSPPNTFGYELQRRHTGYYPTGSFSQQTSHDTPISPLPPFQHLRSIPAPLSVDRRFSYPQVSSLSISESNYSRRVSTPEHEPSYGSEPVSVSIGSNEEGDGRKNKKARAQSMDTDNVPKRVSRKTAVACNFCRGRKLRCDGGRPACNNCNVRNFECEYVSTQRRRGPGKAKKGSRSRKGRSEGSSNMFGDRLPSMVPDDPDLRPFTSVLTLGPPGRTSRSGSAEDHSDAAKHIQFGS